MTDMNQLPPQEDSGAEPSVDLPVRNVAPTSTAQGGPTGWTEVSQDWREVGDEFRKLGARLSTAIRSGWKSEQEQELRGLQDQLRAMTDQVESAIRAARQEAASPETKAQTQRVVEAAREAQASLVEEVRDTVAAGLRTLNAQLRDLADRIEAGRK